MQERWGFLRASVLLGVIWGVWHAIPFILTQNPAGWIVWQTLATIPTRVLIVWIYNNSGKSVFAAILFHVMNNISWAFFPNFGSHYDPLVTGLITLAAAAVAIFAWRPDAQSEYRPV